MSDGHVTQPLPQTFAQSWNKKKKREKALHQAVVEDEKNVPSLSVANAVQQGPNAKQSLLLFLLFFLLLFLVGSLIFLLDLLV